jgi:hypothetical protein
MTNLIMRCIIIRLIQQCGLYGQYNMIYLSEKLYHYSLQADECIPLFIIANKAIQKKFSPQET